MQLSITVSNKTLLPLDGGIPARCDTDQIQATNIRDCVTAENKTVEKSFAFNN